MMKNTAIRTMRQAKGLTLQDVAKQVGASAVTVSRWEREPQRVTIPVLTNLARVLDCEPSELLASSVSNHSPAAEGASTGGGFDPVLIRELCGVDVENLVAVRATSDVMAPTIAPGDFCFVQAGAPVVRGGIFAVKRGDVASFCRAMPMMSPTDVTVLVDNPLYPGSQLVSREVFAEHLIGRVVFIGKKV